MRRILLLATVFLAVASVAVGAPDPWRIRISDLDPNAPYDSGRVCSIIRVSFGSTGGTYLQYYWGAEGACNPAKANTASVNSYNAGTGAISFGVSSATSIENFSHAGFLGVGPQNVLKVGSVWKTWKRNSTWYGHDISYSTSADGYNFSAETHCTTYGSTNQGTASYGNHGFYRTTGGVYARWHGNSAGNWQEPNYCQAKGMATSGIGETVWWDIDTKSAQPVNYPMGDPIGDPHPWTGSAYGRDLRQEGGCQAARACDGNLFIVIGNLEGGGITAGEGLGLYIGTGGELAGGDHYVWLSDPDSSYTITGIGNSLLSGNTWPVPGMSGPSLRCGMPAATWMGWEGTPIGLTANQTDPAAAFLLVYGACWDTDSDGTRESVGSGRAKLWLTRNKADLNFDGTVSWLDISPFSTAYGSSSGGPNWNPDADLTGDGQVNWFDVSPFSVRYGSNCSYNPP